VLGADSFLAAGIKSSRRWVPGERTVCFGLAYPADVEEDALFIIATSQATADAIVGSLTPTQPIPLPPELYIQRGL
jgi:hypothetical protein